MITGNDCELDGLVLTDVLSGVNIECSVERVHWPMSPYFMEVSECVVAHQKNFLKL